MLRKAFVLGFLLTVVGCAAPNYEQPQTNWRQEAMDAAIAKNNALFDAGKLTRVEVIGEYLSASKMYFPQDTLLHSAWSQHLALAKRLENEEITLEKYQELKKIVWERFDNARAQEMEEARAYFMAQDEEMRRRAAIGTALRGTANAFKNTYPQQTQCTSQMVGGQLITNCR